MTSPAKRHFQRMSAQREAAAAAPGESLAGASHYELMLAKAASDRARLHQVQSTERKAAVKRELLPEYSAYVAGVLEGGRGAQDDVLMYVMVWRIDTGDYAGALAIARYALAHKLNLPDEFARQAPVAIAEEFADAALAALQKKGGTFSAELLAQVGELTDGADMPDQVRARLHKAYALALLDEAGPVGDAATWRHHTALERMQRALQLNQSVGVKVEIKRLEQAIAKAAPLTAPKNSAQLETEPADVDGKQSVST